MYLISLTSQTYLQKSLKNLLKTNQKNSPQKTIYTIIMKRSQMQIVLLGVRYVCTKVVTSSSDIKFKQTTSKNRNEGLNLFKQELCRNEICIKDFSGGYTYCNLHRKSIALSRQISNICGSGSGSTVALFCSYDILTILIVWASWMSGQKVLILSRELPGQQLLDIIKETEVSLMISSHFFEEQQSKRLTFENNIPLIQVDHKFICNNFKNEIPNSFELLDAVVRNEALVVNRKELFPQPYLLTHKELFANIQKKLQSWTLSKTDKILYMCPSFHRYNEEFVLSLILSTSAGSHLNILNPFDSKAVWLTILGKNTPSKDRVNVLIAEPKVYQQLILEYEKLFAGDKRMEEHIRDYCVHNIHFTLVCLYNNDATFSSAWFKITGLYLQECRFSI